MSFGEEIYEVWECVDGSSTGDKMINALENCLMYEEHDQWAKKDGGFIRGKNGTNYEEECFDFNNTIAWLEYIYRDDKCILEDMGV